MNLIEVYTYILNYVYIYMIGVIIRKLKDGGGGAKNTCKGVCPLL